MIKFSEKWWLLPIFLVVLIICVVGKIIINGDAIPTFNEPERVSTLD